MSAIFISHSSRDNALAKALERRLAERHHHSVFLDLDPEKGIAGGQSWERTLYRKLRSCRAVVALCTDDYLRSHWCFAEIALARMEGKPVIGLLAPPLADGATLPAILTERQLIDLRKDEDEAYLRLWRALDQLDLRGVASEWDPKEPPYLGLSAYQEEHAPLFFGREEESLAGIELLDRGAPGLILVLGASGSGKSSLVRAGILPRLRAREDWLILDPFRPGRDPWAELAESLVQGYRRYATAHLDEAGRRQRIRDSIRAGWRGSGDAEAARTAEVDAEAPAGDEPEPDERLRRLIDLLERLHDDPPPLTDRLRNYLEWSLDDLRRLCAPAGSSVEARASAHGTTPLLEAADDLRRLSQRRNARVLLVVDQLEELLGRETVDASAAAFLQLLRASIEAEHSPLTVLGTMRSDFLGLFQRHPTLQGVDFESLSLGPMRIDGMRRVIEMPARLAAIEIEEGLVDRLLADAETPDALPLLSFTLAVMCRDRGEDERLTVAAYERLGGLHGTITREADAVLAAARREHREDDLRKALLEMARLSEDGSYARRPVDWEAPEVQRVEPLLAQLVDRRVLVSRLEGERRVIEVAHEALFRVWVPLRTWLENARAELLLKGQVERDAIAWREGGRKPDDLWRGGRLLQARDLVGRSRQRASGGEPDVPAEFVRAGMRRRTRQRATLLAIAVSTIVVLAGFLAFALVQAERAKQEKRRALDMARVAIAGEWLREDPTSGALLLLEVEEPATTRYAPRQLSEALNRGFIAAEYPNPGPVHSVAISADGSRVLTTAGKAALVWEARSGRLLRTLRHDEEVVAAAFDPTGRFVVTRAGEVGEHYFGDHAGRTARVWEVATGAARFRVSHSSELNGTVFSPQGRFLVTTSADGTAQLWDVEAGRLRYTLPHEDRVHDAAFSADGQWFVTLSGRSARVWTPSSEQPVVTVTADDDVETACFSPDGRTLVTAGNGGAQAWDLPSGERGRVFAADLVRTVAFSPDGRDLLTASAEEVRVWNFHFMVPRFDEPIRQRGLVFAGFNADGTLVITASGHRDRRGYGSAFFDDGVRYWDERTGESRGMDALRTGSEPMAVAFDAARRTVVASSAQRVGGGRYETLRENNLANLWTIGTQDPRLLRTLRGDAPISAAAFSSDGRWVLTVAGAVATLWDGASGKPHAILRHDKEVTVAAFAAGGNALVTGSRDGAARVWDVESGRQRFAVRHHEAVEDARLVAEGTLLATLAGGHRRLWRVDSGTAQAGGELLEIEGGDDPTRRDDPDDDVSPDGKLMVVRAGETAQVWDVAARKVRFTLKHGGYVRMAAFIAGGQQLVTAGDEKVARVWELATGQPRHTLPHATEIEASAISPHGRALLTLERDGTAHLWDTATGKGRRALHGCGARDARFIAGGALAITRSAEDRFTGCEAKIMVWDVATGRARSTIRTAAESIGFSDDGRTMYAAERRSFVSGPEWQGAQAIVHVGDTDVGEERFADPFRGGEGYRVVALSPDGNRLLTATGNTASIYAIGGQLLQERIAAGTSVCLAPQIRRQNLGESEADAQRMFEACQRKHGRR